MVPEYMHAFFLQKVDVDCGAAALCVSRSAKAALVVVPFTAATVERRAELALPEVAVAR